MVPQVTLRVLCTQLSYKHLLVKMSVPGIQTFVTKIKLYIYIHYICYTYSTCDRKQYQNDKRYMVIKTTVFDYLQFLLALATVVRCSTVAYLTPS